jgi:hypothetical protein
MAQQGAKTSTWRSSSGATITVTSHDDWVSVDVVPTSGQPQRWQGRWLRKYDLFDYKATGGVTYTAHLVNNNQIQVSAASGEKFTWNKVDSSVGTQPATSYPYAQAVTGRWASSSGNIFDLSSRDSNVYLKAYLNNGQTLQTTGQWLSTVAFRYQFPGFNEIATCTYLRDGRLQVAVPGKTTTFWTKVK